MTRKLIVLQETHAAETKILYQVDKKISSAFYKRVLIIFLICILRSMDKTPIKYL